MDMFVPRRVLIVNDTKFSLSDARIGVLMLRLSHVLQLHGKSSTTPLSAEILAVVCLNIFLRQVKKIYLHLGESILPRTSAILSLTEIAIFLLNISKY
jgi:hypothetical protein